VHSDRWPAPSRVRAAEPLVGLRSPTAVSISRKASRLIVRWLVGVVVFAQLALSAYACPAVMPGGSMSDMAPRTPAAGAQARGDLERDGIVGDTRQRDGAQPNLCAAHCQQDQQNVDAKPAPALPPALLASLLPTALAAAPVQSAPAWARSVHSPPAVGPPIAIRHCCFRL
jgi:hypothetical protein